MRYLVALLSIIVAVSLSAAEIDPLVSKLRFLAPTHWDFGAPIRPDELVGFEIETSIDGNVLPERPLISIDGEETRSAVKTVVTHGQVVCFRARAIPKIGHDGEWTDQACEAALGRPGKGTLVILEMGFEPKLQEPN